MTLPHNNHIMKNGGRERQDSENSQNQNSQAFTCLDNQFLEVEQASSDFMICVTGLPEGTTPEKFCEIMKKVTFFKQSDDASSVDGTNSEITYSSENEDGIERCLLVYSPKTYNCKHYGIVEYTQKTSSLFARNNEQLKKQFTLAYQFKSEEIEVAWMSFCNQGNGSSIWPIGFGSNSEAPGKADDNYACLQSKVIVVKVRDVEEILRFQREIDEIGAQEDQQEEKQHDQEEEKQAQPETDFPPALQNDSPTTARNKHKNEYNHIINALAKPAQIKVWKKVTQNCYFNSAQDTECIKEYSHCLLESDDIKQELDCLPIILEYERWEDAEMAFDELSRNFASWVVKYREFNTEVSKPNKGRVVFNLKKCERNLKISNLKARLEKERIRKQQELHAAAAQQIQAEKQQEEENQLAHRLLQLNVCDLNQETPTKRNFLPSSRLCETPNLSISTYGSNNLFSDSLSYAPDTPNRNCNFLQGNNFGHAHAGSVHQKHMSNTQNRSSTSGYSDNSNFSNFNNFNGPITQNRLTEKWSGVTQDIPSLNFDRSDSRNSERFHECSSRRGSDEDRGCVTGFGPTTTRDLG